jgi:hypothetical protein
MSAIQSVAASDAGAPATRQKSEVAIRVREIRGNA